jgi:predicted nucleotidyltransferase
MPVRSSSSSVLRWPDRETIDAAVRAWARAEATRRPELLRLGYFGSYARGDWGPGSDLDLVAVVGESDQPFERRAVAWDVLSLPVHADLLVYTAQEWEALQARGGRFARVLADETVWVL